MKNSKTGQLISRGLTWCFLVLLLAGCAIPAQKTPALTVAAAPGAWIDGPMDGSTIPLAPYEVIFHIADVGGVSLGELSINGAVAANIPVAVAGETLSTLRYLWTPPNPGEYTLSARAQNTSGKWGNSVSAKVTVADLPPTFTPTPTITITPTATITPTPTKTAAPLPITFTANLSTSPIFNGVCGVNQAVVSAILTHAEAVDHVTLLVRLQGISGSWNTDWKVYGNLSNQGSGIFKITVNATSLPGASKLTKDVVYYQFVAYDAGGKELGRSGNYHDLILYPCVTRLVRPTSTLIPLPH